MFQVALSFTNCHAKPAQRPILLKCSANDLLIVFSLTVSAVKYAVHQADDVCIMQYGLDFARVEQIHSKRANPLLCSAGRFTILQM